MSELNFIALKNKRCGLQPDNAIIKYDGQSHGTDGLCCNIPKCITEAVWPIFAAHNHRLDPGGD